MLDGIKVITRLRGKNSVNLPIHQSWSNKYNSSTPALGCFYRGAHARTVGQTWLQVRFLCSFFFDFLLDGGEDVGGEGRERGGSLFLQVGSLVKLFSKLLVG